MFMAFIAMVGMAVFAVPRGVVRVLAWLIMVLVTWCFAAVEKAYAIISYNFNSTNGRLSISVYDDCLSVWGDQDSLYIADGSTPSLVPGVEPTDVKSIEVLATSLGSSLNEQINLSGVSGTYFDRLGSDGEEYPVSIFGHGGNDTITGSQFGDSIFAGSGNDWINGVGGDDLIEGEAGSDTIQGGLGADIMGGGSEDDYLYHNTIAAGNDPDVSSDAIYGDSGNDTAYYDATFPGGDGDQFVQ